MSLRILGEARHIGACISAAGEQGVGVIVKRVLGAGRAIVPVEILAEPLFDGAVLIADADTLAANKPCTDVLVTGSAYSATPVGHIDVDVAVGPAKRSVRVYGERRIWVRGDRVGFEQLASVREARLSYREAYGGELQLATKRPTRGAFGASGRWEPDPNHYVYPRNPAGRGFALRDRASEVDGTLAPSQEDPSDPVRPERILRQHAEDWQTAPVPGGVGPIALSWFPRAHWLIPFTTALTGHDALELRTGVIAPREIERAPFSADARVLSCAPPGLAVPLLTETVRVDLRGTRWGLGAAAFGLDLVPPRITLGFPGAGEFHPAPQLKTLVLDADTERVTLVWSAFQRTLVPYPEVDVPDISVLIEG